MFLPRPFQGAHWQQKKLTSSATGRSSATILGWWFDDLQCPISTLFVSNLINFSAKRHRTFSVVTWLASKEAWWSSLVPSNILFTLISETKDNIHGYRIAIGTITTLNTVRRYIQNIRKTNWKLTERTLLFLTLRHGTKNFYYNSTPSPMIEKFGTYYILPI